MRDWLLLAFWFLLPVLSEAFLVSYVLHPGILVCIIAGLITGALSMFFALWMMGEYDL